MVGFIIMGYEGLTEESDGLDYNGFKYPYSLFTQPSTESNVLGYFWLNNSIISIKKQPKLHRCFQIGYYQIPGFRHEAWLQILGDGTFLDWSIQEALKALQGNGQLPGHWGKVPTGPGLFQQLIIIWHQSFWTRWRSILVWAHASRHTPVRGR
jgi:hypothetical protein